MSDIKKLFDRIHESTCQYSKQIDTLQNGYKELENSFNQQIILLREEYTQFAAKHERLVADYNAQIQGLEDAIKEKEQQIKKLKSQKKRCRIS